MVATEVFRKKRPLAAWASHHAQWYAPQEGKRALRTNLEHSFSIFHLIHWKNIAPFNLDIEPPRTGSAFSPGATLRAENTVLYPFDHDNTDKACRSQPVDKDYASFHRMPGG
jgi:hypothetical protein